MKRKIYDELIKWKKESEGKYALLIEGVKRVGKSYIVEEFAKKNYKSYVIIDFNIVPEEIKDLFNNSLYNLDNFFVFISSFYGITLYERETLFVFDEVQAFPRARSTIKYLVKDGKYDYIETGSLLSIKENVENIVIPSEEKHLKIYPMDFEEFLWALGEEKLYEYIANSFNSMKPMGSLMHRKAMEYFRQYLVVGGMPQVVETFIQTKDFNKVEQVKRNILDLYKDDIIKHAKKYSYKVKSIFDEIPSSLQQHEKKFKITSLSKDAKYRDYEDAFLWLDDAEIINICFNTNEPNIGLSMNKENSSLKCYMADTGLLISHAFDENTIVSEGIYKKLLFDKLEYNSGMIIENIVSQMLVAANHKLYFYSNSSRISTERMEIDFLISKSSITSKHNVSPIEVKSGKNYTTKSLNKFTSKYKNMLNKSYIIHTNDLKEDNDIIYLPIYMTGLLK